MTYRPSLLCLSICCALALPTIAMAQADATGDAATDLDEVVVTGTRTPVALRESIEPTQVIDRAEILRSQALDLPDLLRGRAGISIASQGGAGKLGTVSIRGTEGDHVLVLVDGIRIGSATAGLAMFHDLPIEQIDRIEIVRGARSALYGSEAIGGVIQVFTRRDRDAVTPRSRIGLGSNNLREASAGIGGKVGRGWFGVDAAYSRTDGINACRGTAAGWGAGCFVDEPDRDGYRNSSINLRGGITLDSVVLDANLLRADSDNHFDGSIFGGNEADNVQQVVGAGLAWTASDRFKLTTRIGSALDKSNNFYADAGTGERTHVGNFDTRRNTASVQGDISFDARNLLSVGGDWQRDDVRSDTAFDITSRDNAAGYLQYQGRFGSQRLQANIRSDDNEQFGQHTTGGLGWGMDVGHGVQLNANWATGFKAPSFNDLYYPFFGNANLRPEASKGFNVGVAQYAPTWNWTFNAYRTRIDDLISYDAAIFLPNNIDQARIVGAELTFDTQLAGWDLGTQLSYTDPRNRSAGSNHDKLLPRRPRQTGRVDASHAFGASSAWRIGGTLNAAGSRYDDAANTVRIGGHATFDARVEYAFAKAWTLQARVSNAFDRGYETIAWYNQPGREYGLSLRYAP